MIDEIRIEKNIPLPPLKKVPKGHYQKILNQMEVGDSVLLETRHKLRSFRKVARRCGYDTSERVDGVKFRCWRV
jgi:hypothetical protein